MLAHDSRLGDARAWTLQASRLMLPSFRYLFNTEVHAYAFSIAANVYLSFFPFVLMLLSVSRRWLHWQGAYDVILGLLRVHLPSGTGSVVSSLVVLVQGRPRLQVMSVFMLFFTASGVFLPLEIALNKVWGIRTNRSFARNFGVSFLLAMGTGLMSFFWIVIATALQALLAFIFGWVPGEWFLRVVSRACLETVSVPFAVSIFFVVYYCLPNGRVPIRRVLPASLIVGLLGTVAKFVYMLTLPLFRFREVYGPFALSVTLLFWAYVGAMIMLFGAHLSVQSFWDSLWKGEGAGTQSRPAEVSLTHANGN